MNHWPLWVRTAIREFLESLAATTPEQAALLIAVGLVLGVFPIMGLPTLLCLSAAGALRLNVVALQFLNNVASPLQLALLAPFVRVGAWLCGAMPAVWPAAAGKLYMAALYAVVGWTFVSVPCGVALYLLSIWLVRRHRQFVLHGAESAA